MKKYISYRSSQLLNALIVQKKDFFTLTDALNILVDKDYAKHWNGHLANQMTEMPDFNDVWRELGKHWRKLQKFIE